MGEKVRHVVVLVVKPNNECGYLLLVYIYGEALPKKGTIFKLQVYKRVKISKGKVCIIPSQLWHIRPELIPFP